MFFSTTTDTTTSKNDGNNNDNDAGNNMDTKDKTEDTTANVKEELQRVPSGTMKNCHVDFDLMDDLLDITDKDTEYRRAWVAIRESEDSSVCSEDSMDLIPDDNSVDYLTAAVSEVVSNFIHKVVLCGCWTEETPKEVVIVHDVVA
ncbi:expressed unknown protein [Seminavis robusta]|uniref:Uncharacterized protein n=1 Tax=Seminavis robusta TaxID=568900 RepID=A0A9N8H9M2_9STRA|nr:expressed unknown protein [Seminavis robusta]|eukprot:Sro211_g087970.1 n/a (146) ;mRNA; f:51636-52073